MKRLNEARQVVSKKVDLLCNDLISAYGELSKQLDVVRDQEGFRNFIGEIGKTSSSCSATRWTGCCGSWATATSPSGSPGEDGEFQLGAYMKYTVAGEPPVIAALQNAVPPAGRHRRARRGGPGEGADLRDRMTPQEYGLLKGQELLAINCTYLGESLAALVFFRDAASPFTPEDEGLLKAVGPVFAVALAGIVRDGPRVKQGGRGGGRMRAGVAGPRAGGGRRGGEAAQEAGESGRCGLVEAGGIATVLSGGARAKTRRERTALRAAAKRWNGEWTEKWQTRGHRDRMITVIAPTRRSR